MLPLGKLLAFVIAKMSMRLKHERADHHPMCDYTAGYAFPPMHIFPGTRFKYNPVLNCVDGALIIHQQGGFLLSFTMAGLQVFIPACTSLLYCRCMM